jgi:hypothetical protein
VEIISILTSPAHIRHWISTHLCSSYPSLRTTHSQWLSHANRPPLPSVARPRCHWATASPSRFAALPGGTLDVVTCRPAARAAPPVDLVQPGRATTARARQAWWTPPPLGVHHAALTLPPRLGTGRNPAAPVQLHLVPNLRHVDADTRIHHREGRRGIHRGKIGTRLNIRRSSERFSISQIIFLGRNYVHIRHGSPIAAHRVRHPRPRKRCRRRGLRRRRAARVLRPRLIECGVVGRR